MAWQKISKENHPVFLAALPEDPRIETLKMFGGVCAMVNGHMSAGLWADTAVVRLSEKERAKVLAMDGGGEFDPMGRGKPMADMVLLPKAEFERPAKLRGWLKKAVEHTATLPPKAKKKPAAKKKTAKKKTAKKKTAKKRSGR